MREIIEFCRATSYIALTAILVSLAVGILINVFEYISDTLADTCENFSKRKESKLRLLNRS